jgi:hypothetical protein
MMFFINSHYIENHIMTAFPTPTMSFAGLQTGVQLTFQSNYGNLEQSVLNGSSITHPDDKKSVVELTSETGVLDIPSVNIMANYAQGLIPYQMTYAIVTECLQGCEVALRSSDQGTNPPIQINKTQVPIDTLFTTSTTVQVPLGFTSQLTASLWLNDKVLPEDATFTLKSYYLVPDEEAAAANAVHYTELGLPKGAVSSDGPQQAVLVGEIEVQLPTHT